MQVRLLRLHQIAGIAQLEECFIGNEKVVGPTPTVGSKEVYTRMSVKVIRDALLMRNR